MGIISALLALLFYSSLVLKDDLNGRLLVGTVWFVMGIVWLVRYLNLKKRYDRKAEDFSEK